MRWFLSVATLLTLLLVGFTVGQKVNDDYDRKIEALEKRLTEYERKIAKLEKEVADLKKQVAQLKASAKIVVAPPSFVPPTQELLLQLHQLRFYRQVPEVKPGFGQPQPAPFPFVQPYYYPLEQKP